MRGNRSTCHSPPDYEHLLLCDGQTINANDYPELVKALGSNVLPNLNGRFLQGGSTAGQYVEAGLPNITGVLKSFPSPLNESKRLDYTNEQHGVLYWRTVGNTDWTATKLVSEVIQDSKFQLADPAFDASRSNSIYGASNTVQPPAYTVHYYICYG